MAKDSGGHGSEKRSVSPKQARSMGPGGSEHRSQSLGQMRQATAGSLRNEAREAAKKTDWAKAAKLMEKAIALHPGGAAKPGSLNHRDLQTMKSTLAGWQRSAKQPRNT